MFCLTLNKTNSLFILLFSFPIIIIDISTHHDITFDVGECVRGDALVCNGNMFLVIHHLE